MDALSDRAATYTLNPRRKPPRVLSRKTFVEGFQRIKVNLCFGSRVRACGFGWISWWFSGNQDLNNGHHCNVTCMGLQLRVLYGGK